MWWGLELATVPLNALVQDGTSLARRSVLSSRFSILGSQFSVLGCQFSALGCQFSVLIFSMESIILAVFISGSTVHTISGYADCYAGKGHALIFKPLV